MFICVSGFTIRQFLLIEDIEDQFLRLPMCIGCKKIYPEGLPDQWHNIKYDETVCQQLKSDRVTHVSYKSLKQGVEGLTKCTANFTEL